jgi:hypothetical protein
MKIKNNQKGAIALIFVIMITTLTLVSSIVVSLINISDLVANYHISEAEEVIVDIDACIDDALVRIASSSSITGSFNLSTTGVSCSSTIGVINAGLKIVTSTATSTSDVGLWSKSIVVKVNVSTSPISIYSYKDALEAY